MKQIADDLLAFRLPKKRQVEKIYTFDDGIMIRLRPKKKTDDWY